jgi:hypothetical protein
MMRATILKICAFSVAGLLIFSSWLMAGRQVIDDVEITEEFGCSVVRVSFNFPVRYVNHFPIETGEDLRVRLDPIAAGPADTEALFTREVPLLPPDALPELLEVLYEGNVEGGPYLTLFFEKPVRFSVEHGSDFRSLLVAVTGIDESEPCYPTQ